jgi:hypothetical protein
MFLNAFPFHQADYGNGSKFGLLFANALALATVPEPTALALFGLGTLGLAGWRLRRKHLLK